MTEDPTRSSARPDLPRYGRVGPADPREDPVTRPAMLPTDRPAPRPPAADDLHPSERPTIRTPLPERLIDDDPTVPVGHSRSAPQPPAATRAGLLWTGLILSAVVLLLLLVFILQNLEQVRVSFLGFSGTLPTGVALLFAAVAGLLLVAIPGGLRMLQLRRAARRSGRGAD
jgi:uncharacterized integral membrane protein